jgi:hypothetical protein
MIPRNLAAELRVAGFQAAAAAGVTDVDSPVADMTLHSAYSDLLWCLAVGTVTAGGTLQVEIYSCDDAAGANPVKVTEGPGITPTSNDSFVAHVVGVPHPFVMLRLKRGTANTALTGGVLLQGGVNKAPTWSPHVTIPWF